MKEIIVNVDNYNENSIKTTEGDNLSEVYKIYICKNKRRIDLTNKIAIMAYVNEYGNKKSNILALNITNASQGEIELPITNVISSENGVYACQVAIYGENNSLEQTAPFSLIVENNIFSKISNTAINSSDFHILSEAIKTTTAYAEKLQQGTENIELQYANKLNEINLNLEEKAEKKEVEVERKRIDLLSKIENGQTEGNTELLDIRVGQNGELYNTAGDSVRTQFRKVNSQINEIETNLSDFSPLTQDILTNKYFYRIDGTLQPFNKYNSVKIEVNENEKLYLTTQVQGTGCALVVWLDEKNKVIKYEKEGTNEVVKYEKEEVIAPQGARYAGITSYVTNPIIFKKKIIPIKNDLKDLDKQVCLNNYFINELDFAIKNISNSCNYDKPVVVFIDDDGTKSFLSKMKPILDEKNVKASVAVITSNVEKNTYMTLSELKQLKNEGFDIISHSETHSPSIFNGDDVNEDQIEKEFKNSNEWLKINGFNSDMIVYPFANFSNPVKYKSLARKYFSIGVNSVSSNSYKYNSSPNDNMYMNRKFIDKTQDFTNVFKPIIDETVKNKGLLIIGSHSFSEKEFDSEYLRDIIDYLKTLKVDIMTLKEAIKLKGNILSIGEFTSEKSFFVGRDGTSTLNIQRQEGWKNAELKNNWLSFNDETVKFMKDSMGFVHLQGTLTGGEIGEYSFELPEGYRTKKLLRFVSASENILARIDVFGGKVTILQGDSNKFTPLNGITFKADC